MVFPAVGQELVIEVCQSCEIFFFQERCQSDIDGSHCLGKIVNDLAWCRLMFLTVSDLNRLHQDILGVLVVLRSLVGILECVTLPLENDCSGDLCCHSGTNLKVGRLLIKIRLFSDHLVQSDACV